MALRLMPLTTTCPKIVMLSTGVSISTSPRMRQGSTHLALSYIAPLCGVMLREGGAPSTPGRCENLKGQCLLDHPPSRMMTAERNGRDISPLVQAERTQTLGSKFRQLDDLAVFYLGPVVGEHQLAVDAVTLLADPLGRSVDAGVVAAGGLERGA